MNVELDSLRERFRAEASRRHERIQASMRWLQAFGAEEDSATDRETELMSMREEAHKMKGAAGVLGFSQLTIHAGALEEMIAAAGDGSALSDSALHVMEELVEALGDNLP